MTEPALDDTVRVIPADQQTPQEWADEEAARAGRLWAARWPEGRDW